MNANNMINARVISAMLLVSGVGCAPTSSPPSSASSPSTATASTAPSPREQFASPEAAAQTLVDALRADDDARLKKILAPDGDDILSSGDPVSDQADARRFLALYDEW